MTTDLIFKVDAWNNFCRVFELPDKFLSDYCFGGGISTTFKMVDWFNPVPDIFTAGCSKEIYRKEVGEIEVKEVSYHDLFNPIINFVKEKNYYNPHKTYLIICNFGATSLIEKCQ